MKKVLKTILIVIVMIICIYALFVIEESIRLKNGGKAPLIILRDNEYCDGDKIEHTEKSYTTNCKGIGYRIERKYLLGGQTNDLDKGYVLIKEEFWLFDKILLWGWIA